MPSLDAALASFRTRIVDVVQEQHLPGMSVAVARGDETFVAAAGIANLNTGAPVVPQTKFQVGSNTKVMTATLIMQLVDAGRVDLDATVQTYLPTFTLADPEAAAGITIRHLLTHTSGIHGDWFEDFGREDDATAKYVDGLADIGMLHTTDELWSYCNSGWVVLGRVLEVHHGQSFRTILRDQLCTPAGMRDVALLPEEAVLGHNAVGHFPREEGGLRVVPSYLLPHSLAAAGSIANMTARDLATFGLVHLNGGKTAEGTSIVSDHAVAVMQEPGVAITGFGPTMRMGLGWMVDVRGEHRLIRHGGGTHGQTSTFLCLPDEGLAFVALTNGPEGSEVGRSVLDEIGAELVGLEPTPLPVAPDPAPEVDLDLVTGTYEGLSTSVTIKVADGRLQAVVSPTDMALKTDDTAKPRTLQLDPIDQDTFTVQGLPSAVTFLKHNQEGRPGYLHFSGRAARRVAPSD